MSEHHRYSDAERAAMYRVIAERSDMRHFLSDPVDPTVFERLLAAAPELYDMRQRSECLDALAQQGILTRCFEDPSSIRFGLPGNENGWFRLQSALMQFSGTNLLSVSRSC